MNIFQKVTLKNLKENRTRTLVTIIGILLSAAMFTAVTVSISSLRHYLISYSIYQDGSWHGTMHDLTKEEADTISSDAEISDSISMNRIGFALLDDCQNESKPYLCVYGITEAFTDLMPVHLTDGRMPQNSSEILLPNHLADNGGINYQLGDTLSLELGTRTDLDGYVLSNHLEYISPESGEETEQLINAKPYTYTVVGFYERPSFEDYIAPGYTALTISDTPGENAYDIYFCMKNQSGTTKYIADHMDDFHDGVSASSNFSLLRFYGHSGETSYNTVLYSLAAILIGIIAFGSISLIYNAFSISVSERTKQFGLLASIGATRQQLTGSVLFEAFFLSIIGIPLGILCGILGIGITFYFTGDMIADYLYADSGVTLSLHPSIPALLIAVLVSLITILVSAWIPARRAVKGSAIEAIRQNNDITIRSKKVKTSKLTLKLFGFHGMLATKNYKRNRKKYRATVVSLFLSVVLFISASSFCAYLTKSADSVLSDYGYDISYEFSDESNYSADDLLEKLSCVSGVTDSSYSSSFWLHGAINSSSLSKEYMDYEKQLKEYGCPIYIENEKYFTGFYITFVEDNTFADYLKKHNLAYEDYFNPEHPTAIMLDHMKLYDGYANKYYTFPMLSSTSDCDAALYLSREMDGYSNYGYEKDEEGNIFFSYAKEDSEDTLNLSPEECSLIIPLNIGASVSDAPNNTNAYYEAAALYYPYSMMDSLFSGLEENTTYTNLRCEANELVSESTNVSLMFRCEDHAQAFKDMKEILSDCNLPTVHLYDCAESNEQERALITVVNIFSYGFIILISLIAAANVFNTISTNITLRKREFAMLKSIGLDSAGFRKMMNFECLLYGFKGLLYGLPVSVLITWLIYRAVSNGLEMSFFIPWYSIVIAVGSVFMVVFATMLYSMQKIKKENIMETLKDENI